MYIKLDYLNDYIHEKIIKNKKNNNINKYFHGRYCRKMCTTDWFPSLEYLYHITDTLMCKINSRFWQCTEGNKVYYFGLDINLSKT